MWSSAATATMRQMSRKRLLIFCHRWSILNRQDEIFVELAFKISSEIGDKRNDVGDKGREHIRQLVVQGFDKIPKPGVFAFQPLNWSCHAHPWCQRRNSQTGENPFLNQETPFQKRSEASITTQGTYNI